MKLQFLLWDARHTRQSCCFFSFLPFPCLCVCLVWSCAANCSCPCHKIMKYLVMQAPCKKKIHGQGIVPWQAWPCYPLSGASIIRLVVSISVLPGCMVFISPARWVLSFETSCLLSRLLFPSFFLSFSCGWGGDIETFLRLLVFTLTFAFWSGSCHIKQWMSLKMAVVQLILGHIVTQVNVTLETCCQGCRFLMTQIVLSAVE